MSVRFTEEELGRLLLESSIWDESFLSLVDEQARSPIENTIPADFRKQVECIPLANSSSALPTELSILTSEIRYLRQAITLLREDFSSSLSERIYFPPFRYDENAIGVIAEGSRSVSNKKRNRKPRTFKNRCLYCDPSTKKTCGCYIYEKSKELCYSHYLMKKKNDDVN